MQYHQDWARAAQTGSPARKMLLMLLAWQADIDGRYEASQEMLAQASEMSVRAVRGHLRRLEEDGLIRRTRQFGSNGSRREDHFELLV